MTLADLTHVAVEQTNAFEKNLTQLFYVVSTIEKHFEHNAFPLFLASPARCAVRSVNTFGVSPFLAWHATSQGFKTCRKFIHKTFGLQKSQLLSHLLDKHFEHNAFPLFSFSRHQHGALCAASTPLVFHLPLLGAQHHRVKLSLTKPLAYKSRSCSVTTSSCSLLLRNVGGIMWIISGTCRMKKINATKTFTKSFSRNTPGK